MIHRYLPLVCLLAWTSVARAQPPAIFQGGVYNSASRIHPALPGGSLAPGMRFTVEGIRFGEPVEIRIVSDSKSMAARVLSHSPGKLEALVPDDAPLGEAKLAVVAA